MYRSFAVKNFRGFEKLTVDSLERVNLFAGKNNVGKTALLEALWIHHGAVNPDLGLRIDSFRGLDLVDPENFMSNLFYKFNREAVIEFQAMGDWGNKPRFLKMFLRERPTVEVSLHDYGEDQHVSRQSSSMSRTSSNEIVMEYEDETGGIIPSSAWLVERENDSGEPSIGIERKQQQRPNFAIAVFLVARRRITLVDVNRFSALEIQGEQEGITNVLKEIEPRLRKLSVVSVGGQPAVFADIGLGRLIPVQLLGDGMARLLSLALAIASASGGMVLVDEVENGLHHTVMQKVWRAIAAFARRYNVQIFATTHSEECIRSAHQAFASDEIYDLRLYRLERIDGKVKSVMYDREMLEVALESGLEVR